ncbi:MAG: peptide-methionine (S)-S-oxide reductase [Synergistaceae bacterium]|nr:peptide-methionine (S)-S-oxide reductase [Synergistaceae bacterium]
MPAGGGYVPRIDQIKPRHLDAALFGRGCFFSSEPRFGVICGVWRTTVGFAGGRYGSPSYNDAGDHAEVVLVEYDPIQLSYGQLLEVFLGWDDGFFDLGSISRVFVKNEFERRVAQAALARHDFDETNARVSPCRTFYKAEPPYQKYFLRASPLFMREAVSFYPNEEALLHSTLATRLNGILGQPFPLLYPPEDFGLYDLSKVAIRVLTHLTHQL